MSQYCTQCGTENVNDAKFCKSCGHSLIEKEPSPSPEPTVIQTEPTQEQEAAVNAENTVSVENSTEVPTSLSGWLLLIPVIAWVLYRLAILAGGNIVLMFVFMTVPNILAEALGGAIAIVGAPLIVTGLIYGVKKANGVQYVNFVKHTLIGSIILLAFGIAANINTIRDEQKAIVEQTTMEVVDPTAPVAEEAAPAADAAAPVAEPSFPVAEEAAPAALSKLEEAGNACNSGNADVCLVLGFMYGKGEGVNQDIKQAEQYYKKACDGGASDKYYVGAADGCYRLANLYDTNYASDGVKQDDKQAVRYYKKACDGGSANGCVSLGNMYASGQGIKIDGKQHVKYYKKGCDRGRVDACKILGDYYEGGRAGGRDFGYEIFAEEDKTLSAQYYKKACDGGDADGCSGYEELRSQGY